MTNARRLYHLFTCILIVFIFGLPLLGQVNVTMRHNDIGQTGANNAETKLKPGNVQVRFSRRFNVPILGDMYAQILVVSGVNVLGGPARNVAFAATGHNMVYAFDADVGRMYWMQNLGRTVPVCAENSEDIPTEVGIVGTPVIDVGLQAMYVVAKTFENVTETNPCATGTQVLRLHALDIRNGSEMFGGPIEIKASYPGTGDGSNNGTIPFDPLEQNQRPGLTLANGNVYIAFASHGDHTPYHGWVLVYDASNLHFKTAFNTSTRFGGAGIWMSGQAPMMDGLGNLYVLTGNLRSQVADPPGVCQPWSDDVYSGDILVEDDPNNLGESFIKLSSDLSQHIFFKALNAHELDCKDSDISSGGAMEIPNSGAPDPNNPGHDMPGTRYLVGGGKDGFLRVFHETDMGLQETFNANGGLIFSTPVWFNNLNRIYFWGSNTTLQAWDWDNGSKMFSGPDTPPASPTPPRTPGGYSANAGLAISSNAGSDGIVWALKPTTDPNTPPGPNVTLDQAYGGPWILYAFDPITLNMLYSNEGDPAVVGSHYAKYDLPTIANGNVYIPTRTLPHNDPMDKNPDRSNKLFVYGLHRIFHIAPLSAPAMLNQPYSFSAAPTDPEAEIPVSYSISGDQPWGTTFTFATGLLTGASGPYPGIFDFTITANYSDGTQLPQEYALSVCQADPPSPNLSVNIPINSAYVIGTLRNNYSGVYSFDLVSGSLPPGMLLDKNTGMVSGTPTLIGTYYPRIRTTRAPSSEVSFASCVSGTTSDVLYQISVSCSGSQCPQYEGYNDGLDSDNVWGWAWDKSQPNSAISVDIYDSPYDVVPVGTPWLARVTANLFRQDLADAGKGNGYHAFVFPIPGSLKDGQAHRIHATFAGTNTDLTWSPRTMTAPGRYDGVHSNNDCDHIDGYAVDNWQTNVPVDVDIIGDGQILATLVANYDSTTVPATSGHGTHGFLYFTPDRLKDGGTHQITIRFNVSAFPLASTNRNLSCPTVPGASSPLWEGYFDNVTCDRVDGWGWDKNRPNSPVDMRIVADGIPRAILTANYFSQDLLNNGKGNGAHRFLYYLPDFLKDGYTHHVTAQIVGQDTDLPISSGITNGNITCAALPPPNPPPPHAIANTSIGTNTIASSGQALGTTPAVESMFSSVSASGLTSFVPVDSGSLSQLPYGYAYPHASVNPLSFAIDTTAAYSAPVSVTYTVLSETDPNEFSALRILHLENGAWVDRTVVVDFGSHRVTTQVNFLGTFVLASLIQSRMSTTLSLMGTGTSTYGQSVSLTAQVVGSGNSAVPSGTVTFMDGRSVLGSVQLDGSAQASLSTTVLSAGTHQLSATYNGDYQFPPASGTLAQVVSPAQMLVSPYSAVREYGLANPAFTGTIAGLQNNDNITAIFQSSADTSSAPGTYAITATLSDPSGRAGNYNVAVQNGVLTVNPAALQVTTNNKTRIYGDPNPVLDGTITGIRNNDNIQVQYSTTATQQSTVGSYPITPTLSDPNNRLGNYTLTTLSGTLTVTLASLQVTANNKTRTYTDPNPVLDGTITGIRNGDNIQAQYSTTATQQSLLGTYPITVTLSDPNNRLGNYNVGIQNGTLTITRSNIALAAPTFSPVYGIYPAGTHVTITEATSSAAAIHYTSDGSAPTASSPLYTGPLTLSGSVYFRAIATQPEYQDSSEGNSWYNTRIPISATPSPQNVLPCASVSYTVSVPANNGVSGTLTLGISGLPVGATASFSPATINNSGNSTLTVTTSTSTPTGTYPLTITVSNSTLSGSTNVNLVVQDFNLSAASSSQTITAGGSTTYSLSGVVVNGFAGTVALTSSGTPAGATATINPTSFTGAGSSTLTVTTSSTATPPGTYTITVTGTSGCRSHSLALTLIVNAPPPTGPVISGLSVSAGPVGTAVTINGTNFGATQGTSTVTFNGIATQPTAWSAGSITAPVPRGAKSGNIVVTAGGQVSNGFAFSVQDDAVHIWGTNCSTCGWQVTDFTIQVSSVYGYTIQTGDILYFYQSQNATSVAGLEVCFPGGESVSCADDGLTVDQDGKPVHADTITGVTHFRRVDLSHIVGQPLSQISFHSHGTTKAGRWDVYFSNIQIVSANGTVHSIFVTGSTPSLYMSSSYGVTGQGSAIEHAHVW